MVAEAVKNYLALATGLAEVSKQRALAASKALVAQGEATREQVSSLAEDLIQTSRTNRATVTALVRTEVEKALNRVGLATADEVARLTRRLQTVEASLRDASAGTTKTTAAGTTRRTAPAAKKPAAKKPAAKKAPAKKPAAKKAPAKKAPAKKATR